MKRNFLLCAVIFVLALVFFGCKDSTESPPKVKITINGISGLKPDNATAFSIIVFNELTDIIHVGKIGQVTSGGSLHCFSGEKTWHYGLFPANSQKITIAVEEIPSGNYVVMLAASINASLTATDGRMYVTKDSSDGSKAGQVQLSFVNGEASLNWNDFVKSGGTGDSASEADDGWLAPKMAKFCNPTGAHQNLQP